MAMSRVCLEYTWAKWSENMVEVLKLEHTYLAYILQKVLMHLPKSPAEEWRCQVLDEWLLISHFIKPMQAERDDYEAFFLDGKSFQGVDPQSLGM
jgi:hypothetical protein